MPEIQIPVDLGFTEFVTTLLSEVVSSIVAAQSDQEERLAELTAAATLSPEEFAAAHVPDEAVDEYLAGLFPPSDPTRQHDAVSAAPYQPASEEQAEQPPFHELLGVELKSSDVNANRGTLRPRGASKIHAAARQQLAEQQLATARALLERGIPRVIVDAGRVSAKLTFEALQYKEESEATEAEPDVPAEESETLRRGGPLIGAPDVVMIGRLPRANVGVVVPQALRNVRMRVRSADERKPETGTARTNVYGEVELTFKTVT